MVDGLQVAQFVYQLLTKKDLKNIVNAITFNAVLILGRFTPERTAVLNAIASELRKNNLIPIIYNFERTAFTIKDFSETMKTLASLSLFIIADITRPSSAPLELRESMPNYPIPFVPIIQAGKKPFTMFSDLIGAYDWVLQPIIAYNSIDDLITKFKPIIVDPALKKLEELQRRKA